MAINYNELWDSAALTYEEYREVMGQQAENGQTSGPNQSEAMVNYTALNEKRMLRIDRKVKLLEPVINRLKQVIQPQRWLVITETWCGDAAQILPVLQKMSEQSPAIEMEVIWRDEYPELMNQHLTNGSRAIPKLICLDADGAVLGDWGPRPREAQAMVMNNKDVMAKIADAAERSAQYNEAQIELQKWYNKDKGEAVQLEMLVEVEKWQQ